MSFSKYFSNIPGYMFANTDEPALQVTFDEAHDVQLVSFSHGGDCPSHMIALGGDTDFFLPRSLANCDPKIDLFVATKYFTESDLPEGFNGVVTYMNDIPVSDGIEAVNGVTGITQATSPSFGAMMVLAACGAIMAVQMVHKAKAIRLDNQTEGGNMSRGKALRAAVRETFTKQHEI